MVGLRKNRARLLALPTQATSSLVTASSSSPFWAAQALSHVHVDFSGVALLAALGLATGLMAYVLVAGSPRE